MTPDDVARFALANDLIAWMSFVVGFITSGCLKTFFNLIVRGVNRPRRIKYRSLNLKNHDFEYLYLFEGKYYTLEQRDFLIKQRLKDVRQLSKLK